MPTRQNCYLEEQALREGAVDIAKVIQASYINLIAPVSPYLRSHSA